MRIALLSDIHGNLPALDAVLSDLQPRGPFDQVIVAGDLAWSGPWPAEVVDRVRAVATVVIQGNTDAFFARHPMDTPLGKDEDRFAAQLVWMLDRLGSARAAYLAGLPFDHRIVPAPGHELRVVHANPVDLERPITPHLAGADLDELLLDAAGQEPTWRALAFGHVHVPYIQHWRARLLVDVASVGLPMDRDPRACYAILTWDGQAWQAEHRRVFYPAPVVAHEMRTCGMPRGKHFSERLVAASYNKPFQGSGLLGE